MTDIKELKEEELEKVSGGNDENGKSKFTKGESVYFKFKGTAEGMVSTIGDVVAFGPIENVYKKSDGFYYDIHHGYLTILIGGSYLTPGYISEKTETDIPEKNVNLTGNFK